jgi:methylamine--corrinoid protein Co-methyltransferase
MLSFDEIIGRALTGPILSEKEYDLNRFVRTLRRIVKQYNIRYDPATPVTWDDDLADRVWQAGLQLIAETGVYCTDTERIIEFSPAELEQAVRDAPQNLTLGSGREARVMPYRAPESSVLPFFSLGAAGNPVDSEAVLLSLTHTYAELPYADAVPPPSLTRLDGRSILAGSPLEIEGCLRTARLAKEAFRRAGRPGLCMPNFVPTGVRAAGHIAAHATTAGRGDMMEIGGQAEMKIDFDSLSKIAYMLAQGCPILGETGAVLGGYCGGPEGTAVTMAAYHVFAILVLRCSAHHPFVTHATLQTGTTRDALWARNVSAQATTRHSRLPCLHTGVIAAGPATGMSLYEVAAWYAGTVVSGGSIEASPAAHGTHPNYLSPLEPLLAAEVGRAVVGMSRQCANDLVLKLLEKYESHLDDPPLGHRYQDCFDVASRRPGPEALEHYRRVRADLRQMGLVFEDPPFWN